MGNTRISLVHEGPREKLSKSGLETLNDSELLALILATGTRDENALELSRGLLHQFDYNLHELAKAGLEDLQTLRGIGKAKASRICAVFELGRRRENANIRELYQIESSRDVYRLMSPVLKDKSYEEFWMLILNRANRVLKQVRISEGSVSGTVADPKKIFKIALHSKASSIVLLHNHPSGQLKPSQADISLTHKLVAAANLLDMQVVDHLIISQTGYYSFADEGQL